MHENTLPRNTFKQESVILFYFPEGLKEIKNIIFCTYFSKVILLLGESLSAQ